MPTPLIVHADIQCVYPISGNYGIALRFLYYVLIFFVALLQRHPKFTAGAAAYCISYAGATAIHAVLLATISASSTPSLADSYVSANDTTAPVRVAGRVLDQDVDATFAVVGVGCFSSLIFAVSTASFRRMAPARSIIVLWGLLMFVCIVACMVNFYGVNESETGPFLQSRFYPPGADDGLPLSGVESPDLGQDWNETIWSFFDRSGQTTDQNCFYPCLASSQMMRDQSDIQIIPFSSLKIAGGPGRTVYMLMTVITWGALPLTVLAGFVLVAGQWVGWFPPADSPPFAGNASLWNNLRPSSGEESVSKRTDIKSVTLAVLQVYALIVTPILMVVLIVFMEWSLTVYPPLGNGLARRPVVAVGWCGIRVHRYTGFGRLDAA
ncbi:hypothetical protein PG997_002367 [Apiospora hydei]|uniref:Uncharacterized protein n=1 Tax=Apiospora hydei TaxID=1337664 RepID=A0ABR1X961_9PEZI